MKFAFLQSMPLRPGVSRLAPGVWGWCAAVAAIFLIAGCAAPSSAPDPSPRPEINPAEVDKLEREAAEIETAVPAVEKEIADLQARRARLELRQQARANGDIHLLYDGATGKLSLYKGSRQLLLAKVDIKPAMTVKKAASTPTPAPSSAPGPAPKGAIPRGAFDESTDQQENRVNPPPAPGRYLVRSIQTLLPPGPQPKIKGRKVTAGGNARIIFGDETHDLGFITASSSPDKPPAPTLPRWNVTVSVLDSLVAAVKPEAALFVEDAPE